MSRQPASDIYDLTIVGGGPAGLFAAFYSGMRDMKTKLIEAGQQLGGRLLVYPQKRIYDVGGIACIRGEDLIRQLVEQAKYFDPKIELDQRVTGLETLSDGTWLLTTACGRKHYTRTLLIAAGRGIVSFNRLELPEANRYGQRNLYYTITDASSFRGKRLLLSGGGDTAVDWANEMSEIAAEVTLVHRRSEFGAHEASVRKLESSNVRLLMSSVIAQLHGENEIEAVSVSRVDETGRLIGTQQRLSVDAVIVSHGRSNDLGPILGWPLTFDDEFILTDSGMRTNLPGVFAAGDVLDYDNKLRLIAGAFNEAAVAVNGAKQYLDPSAYRQAYVSSHNNKFHQ